MIKETAYVAFDGTRFQSEEECIKYEDKHYVTSLFNNGFRAFDEMGDEIPREFFETNFEKAFDRSQYIEVPCEEVAATLDSIHDTYDIQLPDCPGKYRWSDDYCWVELEEELANLNSDWSALGVHFSID